MSRYLVIDEHGQHATLGSYAPAPSEVATLATAYTDAGIGAWIVETTGVYYSRRPLTVRTVADLAPSKVPYSAAIAAFHDLRRERTR